MIQRESDGDRQDTARGPHSSISLPPPQFAAGEIVESNGRRVKVE